MKINRLLLFILLFCFYGISYEQVSAQIVPEADLLDVKFKQAGAAVDMSAKAFKVEPGPIVPTTLYDTGIKQYVSRFTGNAGENTENFYKVNYRDDADFKNQLKTAFSLEVYTKTTSNKAISSVSSAESGGFSIEQLDGGGYETKFWVRVDGKYESVGNRATYSATDPQYSHMVFTYDGTTIKAYYDGQHDGTTTMSGPYVEAPNPDAHWIGIGGDASIYNLAQAAFNGDIGVVRMYSKALPQNEVTDLYNQIETRKSMTKIDDLNDLLSKFTLYMVRSRDLRKKVKAKEYMEEGWLLMGALTTTDQMIDDYIAKIDSELNSLQPDAEITTPVFAAISDTHVGRANWEVKVAKAFEAVMSQVPTPDAIFVTGDITDWGQQWQYDAMKSFIDNKVAWSGIPVYFCMGNHDWLDDWNNNDTKYRNTLGQELFQFIDIKGYPFITLSMESLEAHRAYMDKARTFLTEKLKYAAENYPGKPIFLFQHVPNNNTVYGSYEIGGGDSWGTNNIEDIISNYPQIITISGHTHYPIGDERCIHQDKYTSINDGGVAYSEIENGLDDGPHPYRYEDVYEGCMVSLDDQSNVTVKRLNFFKNQEIKTPWVVKAPHNGTNFTYKGRTGGASPYFAASDKITMNSNWDAECEITFPQATDDDNVHLYRIEILDADKNVLPSPVYKIFSAFYLNDEMPDPLSWLVNIGDLTNENHYYIQVTAVDSYGNESEQPIVSERFTKKAFSGVAASANMLDVRFGANGKATNESGSDLQVLPGKENKMPTTLYDTNIKQYISRFAPSTAGGNTDTFYGVDFKDNTDFYTKLKNEFTVEVYAKMETDKNVNIIGAAANGGFCVEQVGNGGATELWFGDTGNGSYTMVGSKSVYKEYSEYYHIVYTFDGSTITAYYNGRIDASKSVGGYREAPDPNVQWLGIGADVSTNKEVGRYAFQGDIAAVRMYDKAISKEEVYAAYLQMKQREQLTLIDDLNRIITVNLPNYLPKNDNEKAKSAELINEGWGLMKALTTSDQDIQAYKVKVGKLIGSDDVSIHSLKINGVEWNINDTYLIPCNSPSKELKLEIVTDPTSSIDKGKTFTVAFSGAPTKTDVSFVVIAADGYTKKKYNFKYEKESFDFNSVIIQKWGHTLIVNNNPQTNNGFVFTGYEWLKNGIPVSTNQIYMEKPRLDAAADYTVRLTTQWGVTYDVCPASLTDQTYSALRVYPNPVDAGSSFTLKTELPDNVKNPTINVYNTAGILVLNATLTGDETRITAPSKQGMYTIKVNAEGVGNEFKLLVK